MRLIYGGLILAAFILGFWVGQAAPPSSAQSAQSMASDGVSIDPYVVEYAEEKAEMNQRGWAFWMTPKSLSGGLTLKMSEVKAHVAHHGAHVHPEAEIYFILEGTAELTLKDESMCVGKNSAMYCPPHVSHGIRNAGDTPMRYLVIKGE